MDVDLGRRRLRRNQASWPAQYAVRGGVEWGLTPRFYVRVVLQMERPCLEEQTEPGWEV